MLSSTFVVLYALFLHDTDIFALVSRHQKVSDIELEIERKKAGIEELKIKLAELDNIRTLEKYARENHYFKKEDEDIFIFSFE